MFAKEAGCYFAYNRADEQGRFDPEETHAVMQALWGPMKQPRVVRIQDHQLVQINWAGLPTKGLTRRILGRMWPDEDQFCTVALRSAPGSSAEGLLYPPPSDLRLRIMASYDIVEDGGWFERVTDALVRDGAEIIKGATTQVFNNPNLRPVDPTNPPRFNPLDKVLEIAQGVRRDVCNIAFQERYGVDARPETINTAFYYLHESGVIFNEAIHSQSQLTAYRKVLQATIYLFADGPDSPDTSFPLAPIIRIPQGENRDRIAGEVIRGGNRQKYEKAYQEVLELIGMLIDMSSDDLIKLARWRPRDIVDQTDAGEIELTPAQMAVFSAKIL